MSFQTRKLAGQLPERLLNIFRRKFSGCLARRRAASVVAVSIL
jgi:hypothetical protein